MYTKPALQKILRGIISHRTEKTKQNKQKRNTTTNNRNNIKSQTYERPRKLKRGTDESMIVKKIQCMITSVI
jgi:hypothetical protein